VHANETEEAECKCKIKNCNKDQRVSNLQVFGVSLMLSRKNIYQKQEIGKQYRQVSLNAYFHLENIQLNMEVVPRYPALSQGMYTPKRQIKCHKK
jgi:hypothetical protein